MKKLVKFIAVILAAVTLAASVTACHVQDPDAPKGYKELTKEYTSKIRPNSFHFFVPTDWETIASEKYVAAKSNLDGMTATVWNEDLTVATIDAFNAAGTAYNAAKDTLKMPVLPKFYWDNYYKNLLELNFAQKDEDGRVSLTFKVITDGDKIEVAKVDAYRYEYEFTLPSGAKWRGQTVILAKKANSNNVYIIQFVAPADRFDSHNSEIATMLSSFSFIGGGTSDVPEGTTPDETFTVPPAETDAQTEAPAGD